MSAFAATWEGEVNDVHRGLVDLGWNEHFERAFVRFESEGLAPARVMLRERDLYFVGTPDGECAAEIAGRLRHQAVGPRDYPAVGDWVAVRAPDAGGRASIHAVLSRRSSFSRQAAGDRTEEQVVAANLDYVFLVTGLDGDYNLRRIERYLTATWESGAKPVVVLNKADVIEDADAVLVEVEAAVPVAPVHLVSALRGDGLDVVRTYLGRGCTVGFVGSSGVGKSTIINALLGRAVQDVQSVRPGDDRGRHTTTRRQLFLLEDGGLVLDTPGMRELQLWDATEGADATFEEIIELAEQCRFRDCAHDTEPGCAVRAAIDAGALGAERLESYQKLLRELRYHETRRDAAARSLETKRMRAIHRSYRAIQRENRRRKGD